MQETFKSRTTIPCSFMIFLLLLLLLLHHFSHVRLCATPQMAAHQAALSLGFSRQEYWSGLTFPSPVHSCMLSRFSCVQLCATLWTAALQAPLSTGFSRQEYWSRLPFPSLLIFQTGCLGRSSFQCQLPRVRVPDCRKESLCFLS